MADLHSTDHDHDHADGYVHGTMPVTEQQGTWRLFMNLAKWGSLYIAATLLFLTIWFQPGGSFVGGAIAGVVLLVVGTVYLKSDKGH